MKSGFASGTDAMFSEDGWERYKGEPVTGIRDRLHATISPQKKILVNANLYFAMGSPAAVYLFFNRLTKQIALMPASADDTAAFPVERHYSSFFVRAAPFCRHYRIRLKRTLKFLQPTITDDGQLVLDLTNVVPVSRERGGRPGRKEV